MVMLLALTLETPAQHFLRSHPSPLHPMLPSNQRPVSTFCQMFRQHIGDSVRILIIRQIVEVEVCLDTSITIEDRTSAFAVVNLGNKRLPHPCPTIETNLGTVTAVSSVALSVEGPASAILVVRAALRNQASVGSP